MSDFNLDSGNLFSKQYKKSDINVNKEKNIYQSTEKKKLPNNKLFDLDKKQNYSDTFGEQDINENDIRDFSMMEIKDNLLNIFKKSEKTQPPVINSGDVGSVEFLATKLLHIPDNAISDIVYNDKGQAVDFKYIAMFGDGQHYKDSYLDENRIQVGVSAVISNNGRSVEYDVSNKIYYLNEIL